MRPFIRCPLFRFRLAAASTATTLMVAALMATALMLATIQPSWGQTASAAAGSTAAKTVLVVGDSLSAEYGIARGTGWVPLLGRRLAEKYPAYQVVNASISGDTTSGGITRLPGLLEQHHPAIVVLELGSNDALRGLSLAMTEQNLATMAQRASSAGAAVVIVGMQIPPNYGRDYTQRFMQLFPKVAAETHARLVPFLMEGIATDRDLFQADGMHPNENGQPHLLDNVWPVLQPMLH
jgi:acyl-CoA thioesterase-1